MADAVTVLGVTDDAALEADLRAWGIALRASEIRRIASELGRDPSVVEAHAFAAQWSEHCSYKSSRHYLRRLPTTGPTVVQGPQEDAGIVRLGSWEGRDYGVVFAHESHNHPSQVVPFEGAATGIGGIVRDVLCMGARVIGLADPLRFGPLDDPHCRYVAQGAVDGIAAYGNAIGVPNMGGDVWFHEGFRDNCLVNVIALGLVEDAGIVHSFAPPNAAGWDVVLVGKATDRSGFGGAAFSSLVLDANDDEGNRGAVQVPDPFLKSVVMRASYRVFDVLREKKLTVGFKDLGAGGIMGCTAEIAASGGFGAEIDLDAAPAAQPNLPGAVLAVGETQERLTWVVPPEFTPELLHIYNDEFGLPDVARGACAARIGRVTAERRYVLRHGGEIVMDVPTELLVGDLRYDRAVAEPQRAPHAAAAPLRLLPELDEAALARTFGDVLAHPDVCSRAAIFERYDGVVRGATALPCGAADAGLIVPVDGAPLGVALGTGGNPRYGALDARSAARLAVAEAVASVVAVGTRPAGLTDCLNFGNPEVPEQMGELVAAIDGLAEEARALDVPFVSGNVSLYNQSASGRAIPASPIVACVGVTDDVGRTPAARLSAVGSHLFWLGGAQPGIGGTVVAEVLGLRSDAPPVTTEHLPAACALVLAAIDAGLVRAVRDTGVGGLAVSLAELAFPTLGGDAPLGISLAGAPLEALDPLLVAGAPLGNEMIAANPLAAHPSGAAAALFGEGIGFVLEIAAADVEPFVALGARIVSAFEAKTLLCIDVGRTIAEPAILMPGGTRLDLHELHERWAAPLRDFYADAVRETAHV